MSPHDKGIYHMQVLNVPFSFPSLLPCLTICLYDVLYHIYLLLACMCRKNSVTVGSTVDVF